MCSSDLVSPYFIVKSLQLRGRRQIAEPRKYCLVRVIVFFDVCFLYLFCFSQGFRLNSLHVTGYYCWGKKVILVLGSNLNQ